MAAQPVPGPGRFSRRSDLGPAQAVRELPDAAYGEAKTFREQQQAAPLPQAGGPGPGSGPGGSAPAGAGPRVVGFSDPSQFPDEPVTSGIRLGPGPGPVGPRGRAGSLTETLTRLLARDPSGEVQRLLAIAEDNGW